MNGLATIYNYDGCGKVEVAFYERSLQSGRTGFVTSDGHLFDELYIRSHWPAATFQTDVEFANHVHARICEELQQVGPLIGSVSCQSLRCSLELLKMSPPRARVSQHIFMLIMLAFDQARAGNEPLMRLLLIPLAGFLNEGAAPMILEAHDILCRRMIKKAMAGLQPSSQHPGLT